MRSAFLGKRSTRWSSAWMAVSFAGLLPLSAWAGGVTLITHGFLGNVEDWIIPMAEEMAGHPEFKGSAVSCYELRIRAGGGGELSASAVWLDGPLPLASDSGELVFKLDWSTEAGPGGSSSTEVAQAAAAALLDDALLPDFGHALAESPIHLIGHSRGGSVVTEIARELGEQGVWVDQVTTLDPVPVAGFGDAVVTTWENVLFADNYYQRIGGFLVPVGSEVFGAFDRKLTELGGGYGSAHSDAHLWYHATIDLMTPSTDTQADVTQAERASWWTAAEDSGSRAGYFWSRLGSGDLMSDERPGGEGTDAVREGYNQRWDLGAGVSPNRTALPQLVDQWPNVIRAERLGAGDLAPGGALSLELLHQSSEAPLLASVWLDEDRNPWNNNAALQWEAMLSGSGVSQVASEMLTGNSAADLESGEYEVLVWLQQGERGRYGYLHDGLKVTSPASIVADSIRREGDDVVFEVMGSVEQMVVVESSVNLQEWAEVEALTLDLPVVEVRHVGAGSLLQGFYRLRF